MIDRDVPYTTQMPLVDQRGYGFIEVDDSGAMGAIRRKAQLSGTSDQLDGLFESHARPERLSRVTARRRSGFAHVRVWCHIR